MAGVELKKFRPVEFEFGQVHVRGGHSGKFSPLVSKVVRSKDSKDSSLLYFEQPYASLRSIGFLTKKEFRLLLCDELQQGIIIEIYKLST